MSLVPVIALHQIAGVSNFNARCSSAPSQEDVEELAASILVHGVTTPLTLRVENGQCVALDGGRRLAALRALAERGAIDVDFPVPHMMFSGSDEEAAEVSLISFVQRRDLHPVDEFERFAELRDRFALDAEQIAKKTGKSLRFVKERLRLARLAPKVREAWRAGKIVAETAQAFSVSESHAEQEQLLGRLEREPHLKASFVRSELRADAQRSTSKLARLIGLEAYVAAGGQVDEQLFEDDTWLLDAPLLRRLAQEKLEAAGAEIVAREGWGWACYEQKDYERWTESTEPFEGDHTEAEEQRLDAIEDALPTAGEEERGKLEAERDEIETRGILRAISSEERAGLGIYVALDQEGRVEIVRGLRFEQKPEQADEEEGEAADEQRSLAASRPRNDSARDGASLEALAPAPAPAPEPIGKSLRAVLDEATNAALSNVVSRNVSLALVVAVAALGCSYGVEALDISSHSAARHEPKSRLLKRICEERFERALPLCLAAHQEDAAQIPVVFAELVSGIFAVHKPSSFDQARVLLSVAARLADIEGPLDAALDREAFFKASARGAGVEAIRALEGDAAANEAGRLKKPELIQRAALLAKDRHWLPEVLRSAIEAKSSDERSTAQAMVEAIEADDARKTEAAGGNAIGDPGAAETSSAAETNSARIAQFLTERCRRGEQAVRIKASDLSAAYEEYAACRGWLSISPNHFAKALAENGIEKTRLKNGVHYLGLLLLEPELNFETCRAAAE